MTDAQTERLVSAFERIGAALELMVAGPEMPSPDEGCAHPEDMRTSFGVTDGVPDWQCRACGFRSVPE